MSVYSWISLHTKVLLTQPKCVPVLKEEVLLSFPEDTNLEIEEVSFSIPGSKEEVSFPCSKKVEQTVTFAFSRSKEEISFQFSHTPKDVPFPIAHS